VPLGEREHRLVQGLIEAERDADLLVAGEDRAHDHRPVGGRGCFGDRGRVDAVRREQVEARMLREPPGGVAHGG
jgi:hypothetical protein